MTIPRAEAPAVPEAMRDQRWDVVVELEQASGQRLFGYALRLGIEPGRAGDLVQESLLRLWSELGRGTVIVSREAWTFRTLSRLAMDEHRLHRRVARLVSRLGERAVPRLTEIASTDRVAVWSEVDRLPDRQRQVIYLRYQADLSFEEVAHVMSITSSAARNHAFQALRTLRGRLGVDEGGE